MSENGLNSEDPPTPETVGLSGVAMTILAFNEGRREGPIVGTLFGKVIKGMRCLDGDALTVADFSGAVDIWVPRTVPKTGVGINKWFEFDVVAEQTQEQTIDLAAQQAALTEAALSGNPQVAGELALDLIIAIQGVTRPIVANSQRVVTADPQ